MGAPRENIERNIDDVISGIRDAEKLSSDAEYGFSRMTVGEIQEVFEDIVSSLDGLLDSLEDIRTESSELREWGEEQENLKDAAEDELYSQ